MRAHVEAARNAGMHLAFFSGNEMFWRIRFTAGCVVAGPSAALLAVTL
jgi:hypothetical protein